MAKKDKKNAIGSRSKVEAWSPDRPMGLARALNKAGWGTRPQAIEFVRDGRFSVDEEQVFDPLFPVTPESRILLDGKKLNLNKKSYFAFHKPIRVVCGPGESGPLRASR